MRARWMAGLATLAVVLGAQAWAVPIKPDLEKILKEQQQAPRYYEPARAGWNGPEMVKAQESSPNPVYEAYGPASTARAIRASLRAAATPDPVALLGIGMLILLLRVVRAQGKKAAVVVIGSRPEMLPQERKAA